MRFASLGSGSKGNGTLVQCDDQLILIDNGFTLKEVERRLARLGHSPEDLSAILVTHEHGDHIKGVGPLSRKYSIPVYMTGGTWNSRNIGEIDQLELIKGYQQFELGAVRILPIAVPHDAREPAQFILEFKGSKLGILTDLGSVSPHVEEFYSDCDALLLEANHDARMLATGPYPESLKRRVGGPWGHLSNDQAAGFLTRVERQKLQKLVVAHISLQNNTISQVETVLSPLVEEIPETRYACQEEGFHWLSID